MKGVLGFLGIGVGEDPAIEGLNVPRSKAANTHTDLGTGLPDSVFKLAKVWGTSADTLWRHVHLLRPIGVFRHHLFEDCRDVCACLSETLKHPQTFADEAHVEVVKALSESRLLRVRLGRRALRGLLGCVIFPVLEERLVVAPLEELEAVRYGLLVLLLALPRAAKEDLRRPKVPAGRDPLALLGLVCALARVAEDLRNGIEGCGPCLGVSFGDRQHCPERAVAKVNVVVVHYPRILWRGSRVAAGSFQAEGKRGTTGMNQWRLSCPARGSMVTRVRLRGACSPREVFGPVYGVVLGLGRACRLGPHPTRDSRVVRLQELERGQHQFRQVLDPTRSCPSLGRVEVFPPLLELLHHVLDRDLG